MFEPSDFNKYRMFGLAGSILVLLGILLLGL
jgi:hypothetical protein